MLTQTPLYRYVSKNETWRWASQERMLGDLTLIVGDGEQLDPIAQAMAYALMPTIPSIQTMREREEGQRFLAWAWRSSEGYLPAGQGSLTALQMIGAMVGGLLHDLEQGQIRVRLLAESFGTIARVLAPLPGHWAKHAALEYDLSVFAEARRQFGESFADNEHGVAAELGFLNQAWQRIHWLAECREAQAIVFASRFEEPLPEDPDECFALVHRLAWNQPLLRRWPELGRFAPRQSSQLMAPGVPFAEAMAKVVREADTKLEARLVHEGLYERRYALDHAALIELDEMNIDRLAIAPERISSRGFLTTYMVDTPFGAFFGESLFDRELAGALCYLPLCDTIGFEDDRMSAGSASPRQVMSFFGLLASAAWRDLTVANVREEQYESTTVRQAKGKGRRQKARGDLTVVRYLPRLVAARRAQVAEARSSGQRLPPRRYAVGAFSRRLPSGQRRSEEANLFAREIGMPLSDYQTVVHPHWRGGSSEERAAGDRGDERIVRWRSWSALDLLRTRKQPGE